MTTEDESLLIQARESPSQHGVACPNSCCLANHHASLIMSPQDTQDKQERLGGGCFTSASMVSKSVVEVLLDLQTVSRLDRNPAREFCR